MALRLKTTQFAFPVLASMTNNTLTNLTQITVYIPESSVTIRKAWVEVSMDDIITVTGGSVTTKTVNLRLGAAGYTSTTNSNTVTNSGENLSLFLDRDFTSHFTTNWTGTSMTCDVQLQINQSTGTTPGMNNVCCVLNITYEYDDNSATQIKSVWIPLNAPTGALPTTKTSHDTIPNLDTYLPEASKTYRNIFIVTQANATQSANTDHTVTYELSSLGTHVTANYESALATDRWVRYVWNITSYITTNTTHTFNVHSSLAARHHSMQAWMVVTYEFNPSSTTSVMNSIILPMEVDSPMGDSATTFQRSQRDFFVQETNTTFNKVACYVFWQNIGNETGLNARIGTGSFVAYTNTGSALVGGNKGLMIRNDSPTGIIFGRGRNKVSMDIYNTSTTIRGGNIGSFWIINYTSDKSSFGVGAHNHTVFWPVLLGGTGAASHQITTTSESLIIPENNYYVTALGLKLEIMGGGTSPIQGVSIKIERLSGVEGGGLIFENAYSDINYHDSEVGLNTTLAQVKSLFQRWPNDTDSSRLYLESGRRYSVTAGNSANFFNSLTYLLTYHGITYTISGNITNSSGGNVNIGLYRYSGNENVLNTTRSGNGPFTFTWYDNTEPMYCMAFENNSFKGRSGTGIAT